jgi:hypothetical protein
VAEASTESQRLKNAFAQAAEIASVVPESMQEAAFNRALDQLLGVSPIIDESPELGSEHKTGRKERVGRHGATPPSQASSETHAQRLIREIDRTKYPEIFSAGKVADRALRVLRLAENEHGVEWLSAPDIALILSEKFRIRTTHQAVRNGLTPLGHLVDTREEPGGVRGKITVYRIMTPGIEYLDALDANSPPVAPSPKPPGRKTAAKARSRKARPQPKTPNAADKPSRSSRRASRVGPKQALGALIGEGFFDEPRMIRAAQEQLKHRKGLTFTVQELSPALVRLLRDGRLGREQSESGQYEYRRS